MVANAFRGVNWRGFVLQSAAFRESIAHAGPSACAFGLFPKFSTPVEKTVENRQDLGFIRVLADFSRFFDGAKPENRVKSAFWRALDV